MKIDPNELATFSTIVCKFVSFWRRGGVRPAALDMCFLDSGLERAGGVANAQPVRHAPKQPPPLLLPLPACWRAKIEKTKSNNFGERAKRWASLSVQNVPEMYLPVLFLSYHHLPRTIASRVSRYRDPPDTLASILRCCCK